jgi:hypothetical protein
MNLISRSRGLAPGWFGLAGAALLVLDLFLPWQQVSAQGPFGTITASRSGWHGIGVLVGLLAIALIAWDLVQLSGRVPELPLRKELVTAALGAATALFAVLEFLTHDEARHWPAWIGLLLAVSIGAGAWLQFAASRRVVNQGTVIR